MRILLLMMAAGSQLFGQSGSLAGRVSDESGAVVPGATVSVRTRGPAKNTRTDAHGAYSFSSLTPGEYSVIASAPQLVQPAPANVSIHAGANTLDLQLKVAAATAQVTVTGDNVPQVSTEASANVSATIISGADLDALSDDPEDLQADLEALAGPSAGPGGGAIFVDGFSGGQLPPKESIREIRINSNPFTPEYDKLGYGRIEIFTKPGSDKFHGTIGYNLGTDFWNSRNPYAAVKAPFLLQETENSFSGPLGKRASFTLDAERQAVDNGAVSNGVTLAPATLQPAPFSSVLRSRQRHYLMGPHVDYQIDTNNTLSLRYLFTYAGIQDAGIGSFDLISRGSRVLTLFNTGQIGETSVHGTVVNETRFQFFRRAYETTANQIAPELQVSGSFNGGGATTAYGSDAQNSYEFQNYSSAAKGRHFLRFGVRIREQTDASLSPANFDGTFTFGGGTGPLLDSSNQPVLDGTGQPLLTNISSIEQYRRTLLFEALGYAPARIRQLGGGATQFSIASGQPGLSVSQFDIAPFFGDDWKLRPGLTLSLGIRYETQTNMHDRRDFAPRLAIAWAPGARAGKSAKTVIRVGSGLFYDRFSLGNTLTAERFNGVVQQQYVVTSPDFYPSLPALSSLQANRSVQTVQQVDKNLRAPYIVQSALTLERQLPRNNTLALTYTNSYGLHLFRSNVITGANPVFLVKSDGRYNQNQFIANVNSKVLPAVSLFGYYVFNNAMSNTDGAGTFPANPHSDAGEYARAATDIRHRVLLGGTVTLRWNIRLNPLFTMQSGTPYNITTGEDNFGTTLFSARPAIAADAARPGVVRTQYGLLDPNPVAGETLLSRNFGAGPEMIMFNLRVSKTWGFGAEKDGSGAVRSSRDAGRPGGPALGAPQGNGGLFGQPSTPRKYNLTLAMSGRNLLNHNNPGLIIGNIQSPLFGRANQIAGTANGEGFLETASNRRLELQVRFTY